MTMADFVARMRAAESPDGAYYYYSGPLQDFPEIADEVETWEWLVPLRGANNATSVWMGYNGSTAHTHYDIFHNYNVQIYGRKRFQLFPPSEWRKLYHYPRHHPSCASCAASKEGWRVVLTRGRSCTGPVVFPQTASRRWTLTRQTCAASRASTTSSRTR